MHTTETRAKVGPARAERAASADPEHVLFATDGGDAGTGALEWLARRAEQRRLDIDVLTVVERDWTTIQLLEDVFRDAAEEVLDAAEAYLARTAPSAEVRTAMFFGDARAEFANASANADLLLVGSNRTGALSGMLGASFSTRLVEAGQCPVVVVPKTWRPGTGAVVVGVLGDGSDEAALRLAVDEATLLHRELRVIHVRDFPAMVPDALVEGAATAGLDAQGSLLSEVVDRIRTANPELLVRGILVEGHPAGALLREAEGAELLVVGRHGWRVMERFFIGSISRDIIARPPCPVAVVRPVPEDARQ
ncbi:MAG: hypothetical protein JWR33_1229 [Naasia sp.]|jgi:nucleotide-binding universal stress UspA family protein|uniref:universal stress protein n=1 Tax=Naasia sp. TaxID=2546198 RepID=UPI00260F4C07|nr:universal stress protein [Naasia sp.]MCU1570488.1 hypothetical protein [Naasia sp.]